jgi:hypothetical protein
MSVSGKNPLQGVRQMNLLNIGKSSTQTACVPEDDQDDGGKQAK